MVNKSKALGYIILFSIIFTGVAQGSTIIVCPSGCTYSSIQDAINGARLVLRTNAMMQVEVEM